MPTGDNKVGAKALHVDGHVRHALARVEQKLGAVLAAKVHDEGHVKSRPEHVGDMGNGHELHLAIFHELRHVVLVDALVRVEARVPQLHAVLLRKQLPRHDIAVVLGNAENDGVALLQLTCAVGKRHEVDGLRRVARPDHLARRRRVDEACDRCARFLKGVRRARAERVHTAVNVRVVVRVVVSHGVDDARRLLARRGVVEVHERHVRCHLLVENFREVFASHGHKCLHFG
mmetsp:Transcript_385/g.955  ORF Transcript_385/g.955 Transcript_385/m.955 type:complete len:231 (+) Transcript_385:669-1361(+)